MNDVSAAEAWGLLALGFVLFGVLAVTVVRVSQRRQAEEAAVLAALRRAVEVPTPVAGGLVVRLSAGSRAVLSSRLRDDDLTGGAA